MLGLGTFKTCYNASKEKTFLKSPMLELVHIKQPLFRLLSASLIYFIYPLCEVKNASLLGGKEISHDAVFLIKWRPVSTSGKAKFTSH